jgi:hypothetical protein
VLDEDPKIENEAPEELELLEEKIDKLEEEDENIEKLEEEFADWKRLNELPLELWEGKIESELELPLFCAFAKLL